MAVLNTSPSRRSRLQAQILMLLGDGARESHREIGEALAVHRPSVSRAMARLEERGEVVRGADGWTLTDSGRRVLPGVRAWLGARLVPDELAWTIRSETARPLGAAGTGAAEAAPVPVEPGEGKGAPREDAPADASAPDADPPTR